MRIPRSILTAVTAALIALACRTGTAVPAGPVTLQTAQASAAAATALPNGNDSLKLGVIGDFGTGKREQYQLGEQMVALHGRFPFELVLTVGDNIYGSERPQDFRNKFETPYKGLLSANVKFYASLGNHDSREQRYYKLFNMEGNLYYSFKPAKQDVRFFALESTYPDPVQMQWLEKELSESREDWKIAYFHHPLYSSGERHGSSLRLRDVLEPLFVKYGVSVVFAGHDHFYERVKPQKGIAHFVIGSGGQLRRGNLDARTGITARGFDTDLVFLAVEIAGDEMYFNAISRTGQIVDSGSFQRRMPE